MQRSISSESVWWVPVVLVMGSYLVGCSKSDASEPTQATLVEHADGRGFDVGYKDAPTADCKLCHQKRDQGWAFTGGGAKQGRQDRVLQVIEYEPIIDCESQQVRVYKDLLVLREGRLFFIAIVEITESSGAMRSVKLSEVEVEVWLIEPQTTPAPRPKRRAPNSGTPI